MKDTSILITDEVQEAVQISARTTIETIEDPNATKQELWHAIGEYVVCASINSSFLGTDYLEDIKQGLVEAGAKPQEAEGFCELIMRPNASKIIFSLGYGGEQETNPGIVHSRKFRSINRGRFIRGIIQREKIAA